MSGRRSALIVATSVYKDARLPPLSGPTEDATALKAVLSNPAIGGFDVRVALNSRVDTLRRTLETFFADRAREDLLLVHFSGHGLKDDDGQLYLTGVDTQLDRLLSTGIDAAWVNRLMNRCRSETIALLLDCCFAGAFTSGLTRRGAGDSAGVKDVFQARGLVVIAASDAMQYAFEAGRQVGEAPAPSPFTKALVDGLATGEADRDEDGEVSINELFDFIEDRMHALSPHQTPTRSAFNQVGDWSIAKSTRVPKSHLPPAIRSQLASDSSLDRFNALFDLQSLLNGPDSTLAGAAHEALERLAVDDSQRVSARARQILEQIPPTPPRATPTKVSTPRKTPPRLPPASAVPATATSMPIDVAPPAKVDQFLDRDSDQADTAETSRRRRFKRLGAVAATATVLIGVALGVISALRTGAPGSTAPPSTSVGTFNPFGSADTMKSGEELVATRGNPGAGGRLIDVTGEYQLRFGSGGDVEVVFRGSVRKWHANVTEANRIFLQTNGLLKISDASGHVVWDSQEIRPGGDYYLLLQDDGNLILKPDGSDEVVWKSQSDGGCLGDWCGECLYNCTSATRPPRRS